MNIITPAELAEHRADARDRMDSHGVVRRKTGKTAQNEATGVEQPVWAVEHADEPCRYVAGASQGAETRKVVVGGVEYQVATGRLDFRHDLDNLLDGDHVELTAGECAGTVLRVVEATKGDQRTARRVPVVEVPRPVEWEDTP